MTKVEFLNTRTASKESGLSVRTIQKLIHQGSLPARKFSNMFLLERKKWEEWKARNIVAA